MQNDGGITASGAFFDSVVAKSDFVNSGYILSVIFQIVATVRLILSGLADNVFRLQQGQQVDISARKHNHSE